MELLPFLPQLGHCNYSPSYTVVWKELSVTGLNVIPRPMVVSVITDLLRDHYPIMGLVLATNIQKTESSKAPHVTQLIMMMAQPSHCQPL